MKKNATLIAGILILAGCASSQGQRASYSNYEYDSPSRYDRADGSIGSAEVVERDSRQSVIPPSDVDVSSAVSYDAAGASGRSVSSRSSVDYDHDVLNSDLSVNDSAGFRTEYSNADNDISADSSKRGGSIRARGYDRQANADELEGMPDPINPGRQADSTVRGGSTVSREREWNHDSEPSSGTINRDHHLKADSSIRGGSIEARGGREARATYEGSDYHSETDTAFDSPAHINAVIENDSRDDFGQGSSATWESDKASGSVRGSANWNPSDDLLQDGLSGETQSTTPYEFNKDASVGGAATSESGEGSSSLDDEELNSQLNSDLNSSEQLESNISGDIDLEKQNESVESERSNLQSSLELDSASGNASAVDTFSSSTSSERSTDIHHDEADLNAVETDIEASGAAASSEVGTSSDVDSNAKDNFQSNDPAMRSAGSPLGTQGGEPNFLYLDNRAQGIGSASTGDFAAAPVNQDVTIGGEMSDDQMLARKVKTRLTQESTGTHGIMMHNLAKSVHVTADEGEVTLTGVVPSEEHKDLIEIRAREIAGVEKVNNQITVSPDADSARGSVRGSDLEEVTNERQQ